MVAPVTGPFTTEVGGTGPTMYYSRAVGYKQAKPFTVTTPYQRKVGVLSLRQNSNETARSCGTTDYIGTVVSAVIWNQLASRVYDKLKDSISSRANMAVNLAEVSQSLSMIRTRSLQLLKFGVQLSRGNFLGAARTLRMSSIPKGVTVKRSLASNYLEFHFGWAPLIGDVHSAIDILQNPIKDSFVKVGAKVPGWWYNATTPVEDHKSSAGYPTYQNTSSYTKLYLDTIGLQMGCKVSVSNPNLWLANQLGLVNPLVLAYELIPFSFIADWFINVEQFLSMGTDFYGLTLSDEWTSKIVKGRYDKKFYRDGWYYNNSRWNFAVWNDERVLGTFAQLDRSQGLTRPNLFVRPWRPWGWRRTAAAVSLLTQQLNRFSK